MCIFNEVVKVISNIVGIIDWVIEILVMCSSSPTMDGDLGIGLANGCATLFLKAVVASECWDLFFSLSKNMYFQVSPRIM
jgi:hypothetical protein